MGEAVTLLDELRRRRVRRVRGELAVAASAFHHEDGRLGAQDRTTTEWVRLAIRRADAMVALRHEDERDELLAREDAADLLDLARSERKLRRKAA